jgi:ribosomal protein S21
MQIVRKPKENSVALIKRFTQKVRESGILVAAKKSHFYDRKLSRNRRRKNALERAKNRAIRIKLRKMGRL